MTTDSFSNSNSNSNSNQGSSDLASSVIYVQPDRARVKGAYERVAPELASVARELLARVNVDVPTAVGKVQVALPRMRTLREQIAALPGFDIVRFDRIEDFALALLYVHAAYLVAWAPAQSIEELTAEATTAKEELMGDASTQATRKIFEQKHLDDIRSGTGYRDLGEDLMALVQMYRGRWSRVEGRTAISLADLERAELLSDRLILNAGIREEVPVNRAEAVVQRERAFYLLSKAYEDARQAIAFVRRGHGDADKFAPSFYTGRPARKGNGGDDEGEATPGSAAPNMPGGAVPNTPGNAVLNTLNTPNALAGGDFDGASKKVGMPGSDPFTR